MTNLQEMQSLQDAHVILHGAACQAAAGTKPTPVPQIVAVNLGITRVLPVAPKPVAVFLPMQKAPAK